MSISYVEFQKLLNPAVPEKFKLIYEILYYYKIDIEELLGLTTDRVIYEAKQKDLIQGFKLTNDTVKELSTDLFERLINYLEYNKKEWGPQQESFLENNKLTKNYVFESNKKGHKYTVSTLYKKFKEHCLKVGILRDLALGSLINTDLGRMISIINAKLDKVNEKVKILFFSFESDELSRIIRYYILHLNYEEIIGYEKETTKQFHKELFFYPFVEITLYEITSFDSSLSNFSTDIELSDAILVYGVPSKENLMLNITREVLSRSANKITSYIIDGNDTSLLKSFQDQIESEIRKDSYRKGDIQLVMLKSPDALSNGINLITGIERFLESLSDKLSQLEMLQIENE